MTNRLGAARLMVKAALRDASTDGRHWLLIVDEAQRSSTAVWEEIQVLVNCLGRREGFAAMIVLGQTELVRDLATRPLDSLAACMSLHLHLLPLDLDEARELLSFHGRASRSAEAALEELHRDALGNPARLLRLAESRSLALPSSAVGGARGRHVEAPDSPRTSSSRESRLVRRPDESIPAPVSAVPPSQAGLARSPSLIPSRPPIRFEDGLVEVGWEGDLEAELAHPAESVTEPEAALAVEPDSNEELVEDRYAALQAWTEWTRNRERSAEIGTASGQPNPPFEAVADPVTPFGREQPADPAQSTSVPLGSLRAETPHDFAPYSQLFTRLRQSEQS
jgi:general secretion pathway protein A